MKIKFDSNDDLPLNEIIEIYFMTNIIHQFSQINSWLLNDHKVKPLHIMLHKTSAYVKSYDGQTKQIYFWIEDDDLLENIILFGIKSVLI